MPTKQKLHGIHFLGLITIIVLSFKRTKYINVESINVGFNITNVITRG